MDLNKQAELLTGVEFDDVTEDNDGHIWSQICCNCDSLHTFPNAQIDKGIGNGLCGVKGCDNEAEHYIDFEDGRGGDQSWNGNPYE